MKYIVTFALTLLLLSFIGCSNSDMTHVEGCGCIKLSSDDYLSSSDD
ncbi:MAG: hypothetical protein OCC49_01225 [Fibrobacterales bacterium]